MYETTNDAWRQQDVDLFYGQSQIISLAKRIRWKGKKSLV
jgi:hypothetical protein